MKETYRLHQAAFLMVDREPPPDALPKDAGTRQVGKITLLTPKHFDLEPKACPYDVDQFLKGFLQIIIENRLPDLGDKLHRQQISFQIKAPGKGYIRIKNSRELVHWLHHKVELYPLEPTNINDFFPIILEKSDLELIAQELNLCPAFLKVRAAVQKPPPENKPFSIPVPDGTTWGQIGLKIVNDEYVEISYPGRRVNMDTKTLGFKGKEILWALLKLFAKDKGTLNLSNGPVNGPVKANVSNLRKHLQIIFPSLKGKPIKDHSRINGYECNFKISTIEQ